MTTAGAAVLRERILVGAALLLLALAGWIHVWRGAGMGMTALQMTELTLFPHRAAEPMAGMPIPVVSFSTIIAMWWLMMVAMMTPAVIPLVLLHRRGVALHRARGDTATRIAGTGWLVAGYLGVWLLFAVVASALQLALRQQGLISGMVLWSRSAALSGVLLIAAGLYQLSPWKQRCLAQCRGPAAFLARHWRPGAAGALRLGAWHGLWCVGCCGVLMLLLFVGGVMNLVWIAVLALLVSAEKLLPRGPLVGRIAGVLLIVWGLFSWGLSA